MTEEQKEKIEVEEEMNNTENGDGQTWREEMKVASEELFSVLQNLVTEANVRRIIVKQGDRVVLDVPLLLGLAGMALIPMYAALGVIVTLGMGYSIIVERQVVEEKAVAA